MRNDAKYYRLAAVAAWAGLGLYECGRGAAVSLDAFVCQTATPLQRSATAPTPLASVPYPLRWRPHDCKRRRAKLAAPSLSASGRWRRGALRATGDTDKGRPARGGVGWRVEPAEPAELSAIQRVRARWPHKEGSRPWAWNALGPRHGPRHGPAGSQVSLAGRTSRRRRPPRPRGWPRR